jgi:PPE-repeat protein
VNGRLPNWWVEARQGTFNTASFSSGDGVVGALGIVSSANVGSGNHGSFNIGSGNIGDMNLGGWNLGSLNAGFANHGSFDIGIGNHGSFDIGIGLSGSGVAGALLVGIGDPAAEFLPGARSAPTTLLSYCNNWAA